ncbi:hypothetical protein LINGRAHAP2_LOCUS31596 [Linum grandiflorum]
MPMRTLMNPPALLLNAVLLSSTLLSWALLVLVNLLS